MLLRASMYSSPTAGGGAFAVETAWPPAAAAAQFCNSRAGMQRGHPQLVAGEDHNVLDVSVLDVLQHAAWGG